MDSWLMLFHRTFGLDRATISTKVPSYKIIHSCIWFANPLPSVLPKCLEALQWCYYRVFHTMTRITCTLRKHYCDVAWASSPANQMFVQENVPISNKGKTKLHITIHSHGELTGDRWFPSLRANSSYCVSMSWSHVIKNMAPIEASTHTVSDMSM